MTTMLEIRSARNEFVVFDTAEAEPIMRFGSQGAAAEFIVELTIAECHAHLQAWTPPVQAESASS
jgi:hypothetical protein